MAIAGVRRGSGNYEHSTVIVVSRVERYDSVARSFIHSISKLVKIHVFPSLGPLRPVSAHTRPHNSPLEMNVEQIEEKDGVRFSWNVFPPSKTEGSKLVVPVACLYTPLKERTGAALPTVAYEPVVCKAPCRAILNPYCQLDVQSKFWICPFCLQRNPFPPQYRDVSPQHLPPEVLEPHTTMEYVLPRPPTQPPVFFFVIDTCLEESDLETLKETLVVSLNMLPPKALVGVITYGTMVQVHEVGFGDLSKSFVFRGEKEYTTAQIQDMLGLGVTSGVSLSAAASAAALPPGGLAATGQPPQQASM